MAQKIRTIGLILALGSLLQVLAIPGAARGQAWQPPEPDPTQDDWIKLVSGEWLRGTLEELRDKDLQFDSKELDLLKLDWDDVPELRSPRNLSYRFEDIGTFEGPATVKDGVVSIRTVTDVREFPRDQLLSIIPEGQTEWSLWSAKASFGLVARAGNTDQRDLNTSVTIRRKTTTTRFDLRYLGNNGKVNDQQTINNHSISTFVDLLVAAGFYVTPISYNYFRDTFQNIAYRNTVGAGVGYVITRGGKIEWSVGIGGAYQASNFVSVQEGADDKAENGSVVPSTEVSWDITKDLELDFNYEAQIGVPQSISSFHHLAAVFSMDLWGDLLGLDFSFYWDRNQNPQEDADGNVPRKDDYRTVFGFGIDF